MSKPRVLVVEDDAAIRQGLVDALQFEGYTTDQVGQGNIAEEMAVQGSYDLILLDMMLPGKDGLDILRQIRASRPTLPVIVITARGAESDRVRGLREGADDYVVKPFSVRELLARVEAVMRRSPGRPTDVVEAVVPGGMVDLARREVRFTRGQVVELSEREVELLRYLVANAERAIGRDELLARIWRVDPHHVETRTIDMHVARLREKLRDQPTSPDVIITVRGKGYMYRRLTGVVEKRK